MWDLLYISFQSPVNYFKIESKKKGVGGGRRPKKTHHKFFCPFDLFKLGGLAELFK